MRLNLNLHCSNKLWPYHVAHFSGSRSFIRKRNAAPDGSQPIQNRENWFAQRVSRPMKPAIRRSKILDENFNCSYTTSARGTTPVTGPITKELSTSWNCSKLQHRVSRVAVTRLPHRPPAACPQYPGPACTAVRGFRAAPAAAAARTAHRVSPYDCRTAKLKSNAL